LAINSDSGRQTRQKRVEKYLKEPALAIPGTGDIFGDGKEPGFDMRTAFKTWQG